MPAIIDSSAMQAIFECPCPDGTFDPPTRQYFAAVGARRPILLLAFAPKAAGTYFRQAAMHAIGGQLIRGEHASGGRDASPYLPTFLATFLDADAPPAVMHMHMQALAANRNFIDAFGLKPVIMLRNLPDMLASFLDMLEKHPAARLEGLNCLIPPTFTALDRETRTDIVINLIAPWFVSYFATWKAYVDSRPGVVCVLDYRAFSDRPVEALHRALRHGGFPVSEAQCEAALATVWKERENFRFNKAVGGRGQTYFSDDQLSKLEDMLSWYDCLKPWMPALMDE
ncbi:MAG: hypothetical protein JSR60_16420 [Proteobacteria bacterium]|nr:hypothetical protein [Pseudomonadota bacterium]